MCCLDPLCILSTVQGNVHIHVFPNKGHGQLTQYYFGTTSHQVANDWIAFVIFVVLRVNMNHDHFIHNADNLLSAALIKAWVGSLIANALLPKFFISFITIHDPCIPWWHHAQCESLQHMVKRLRQHLLLKWTTVKANQYLLGRESHVHILGSNLGK